MHNSIIESVLQFKCLVKCFKISFRDTFVGGQCKLWDNKQSLNQWGQWLSYFKTVKNDFKSTFVDAILPES